MRVRHDLVRADPARWAASLAGDATPAALPAATRALVEGWAEAGWPLIVRRRLPGETAVAPGVPVGLPLPPAHGKRRLALLLPEAALRDAAPVRLADTVSAAPACWRPTIASLLALDPAARVFGSLLWAHLTGLPYLGPDSDLDLLWTVADGGSLEALLAGLAAVASRAPVRLDGEVALPGGRWAHWRELASGADPVLVKTAGGVARQDRADLFA